MGSYLESVVFIVLLCYTTSSVYGLPAAPGCNTRPVCSQDPEEPCNNGTFFVDPCWPQAFYECSNGWPFPNICPDPLIFHPITPTGTCDQFWTNPPDLSNCGCDPSCAIPPQCPDLRKHNAIEHDIDTGEDKIGDEEPCNGTRLIRHSCDCQFYWECDNIGVAHLRVCGAHEVFVPRPLNSGTCVAIQLGLQENIACTLREAFNIFKPILPVFNPVLPVAPAPLPRRHPIHDILAALPPGLVPPHLLQYTKIKYTK